MNEYEECLYNHIMENKFRELPDSREYITLRRNAGNAERAPEAT